MESDDDRRLRAGRAPDVAVDLDAVGRSSTVSACADATNNPARAQRTKRIMEEPRKAMRD
jgi:hypothetical protein